MTVVFWTSLLLLVHVYGGYLLTLRLIGAARAGRGAARIDAPLPAVTVLITAYNEEANIRARIDNVLACRYPRDRLQVLVASDRSTDGTDAIVRAHPDPCVRLFRPGASQGKTDTQNQAIAGITSGIVVFTDADTQFEAGFLEALMAPFADHSVGGVTGHLLFISGGDGGLPKSQGYYWSYELRLRQAESDIGWLAVGSGACLAIRRELVCKMTAAYGEDCIMPLEVVGRGYRMVHATAAVAYDRMPDTPKGELRARSRMTLRNWQGTLSRPALLNPLVHPGYAYALWSHKILRWLSPLWLLLMTLSATVLALTRPEALYRLAAISIGGFYALGLLGSLTRNGGPRIPGAGIVHSFLLANAGFAMGLYGVCSGRAITRYK